MADWRRANGREEPWNVRFFGVGNENWGCGGNMRPEYYADLYRRYQTYVRNYGTNKIHRIACGPNVDDYAWMETLMKEAGRMMDAISLHYYTVPGPSWQDKGSATDFGEEEWFVTLEKTRRMDELIRKHSAIMDQYDPEKRVGLIVDEWGTWHDVEPGSNPGFLYQQNTMRDALVAGIHFHIFHEHCDRVEMANIAQVVNVLQSVILTEGERMLLTPTYHVFDMFKVHQDAALLSTHTESEWYEVNGRKHQMTSVSASKDDAGRIHISLCNVDPHAEAQVSVELRGLYGNDFHIRGSELTSTDMNGHNTFDQPDAVSPREFKAYSREGDVVQLRLAPKSVTMIEIVPA